MSDSHLQPWPSPTLPIVELRQHLINHAYQNDFDPLYAHLDHHDPAIRSTCIKLLIRSGQCDEDICQKYSHDVHSMVRFHVAQAIGMKRSEHAIRNEQPTGDGQTQLFREEDQFDGILFSLLLDPDPLVVEVAAWAIGENPPLPKTIIGLSSTPLEALCSLAEAHTDPLCREAAIAALGACQHPESIPTLLKGCQDKAPIRRRAFISLASFESDEIDEAIERGRSDRDWQVRQIIVDLYADKNNFTSS